MNVDIVQKVLEVEHLFLELEEKGKILSKSSIISKQAREAGNQLYTKKKHDQSIHRNTLLQYTKSIAFALKDSEELALGYSNRSALLLHLHYYKESMFDIHNALEITKCEKLKSKLESRREKCMMLMNNKKSENLDNQKFDEINIKRRSEQIPTAAECVSLEYNKTYGRHLIANRDIKAGEIVIAEKAYAGYPFRHHIYLVCSHCLTFAWNGIPCDFCPFAIYCNDSCKSKAWDEYHSIECPLLKFLHSNIGTGDEEMLVDRIFIKAVKAEGFDNVMNETQLVHDGSSISALLTNGVLDSNKFRSCYNLYCRYPNYRQNTNDYFFEYILIYLWIKKTNIIKSQSKQLVYDINDKNLLIQLKNVIIKLRDICDMCAAAYLRFKCDCECSEECFKECDSRSGMIIAPCISLVNHSCMPNLAPCFKQQRKCFLYASRPIKKGEQLYVTYGVTATMDQTVRQLYTMKNFNFICACPACIDNKTIDCVMEINFYRGIASKIFPDFQKKYKDGQMGPSLETGGWTVYNKELVEQALTIIELAYRHCDSYTAFTYSIAHLEYLARAFCNLYGEKYVMPGSC